MPGVFPDYPAPVVRNTEACTEMVTMRGMRRAIENPPVLRGYTETRHKVQSWDRERRTVARIEVIKLDLDIRFVVTSLDVGSAEWIFKDE